MERYEPTPFEVQERSLSPEEAGARAYREAFKECLKGVEMTDNEKNEAAAEAAKEYQQGGQSLVSTVRERFKKAGGQLKEARAKGEEAYREAYVKRANEIGQKTEAIAA